MCWWIKKFVRKWRIRPFSVRGWTIKFHLCQWHFSVRNYERVATVLLTLMNFEWWTTPSLVTKWSSLWKDYYGQPPLKCLLDGFYLMCILEIQDITTSIEKPSTIQNMTSLLVKFPFSLFFKRWKFQSCCLLFCSHVFVKILSNISVLFWAIFNIQFFLPYFPPFQCHPKLFLFPLSPNIVYKYVKVCLAVRRLYRIWKELH